MKKKPLVLMLIALSNEMAAQEADTHLMSLLEEETTWNHLYHKLIKKPQKKQLWQQWWPGWKPLFGLVPTCVSYLCSIKADTRAQAWKKECNHLASLRFGQDYKLARAELQKNLWKNRAFFWFSSYVSCLALTFLCATSRIDVQDLEEEAFLLMLDDWQAEKCSIPSELVQIFQDARVLQLKNPKKFQRQLPSILKLVKEKILRHAK